MQVYFDPATGHTTTNAPENKKTQELFLSPGNFLKSTIFQLTPSEYNFYPQILTSLYLNVFKQETLYQNIEGKLVDVSAKFNLSYDANLRFRH